jgi:aspartate/methionine/tyrosine aminotransferase
MGTPLPKGSLISYMSSLVKEKGGINLAQGLPGYEPPAELISFLIDIAPTSIHQYPPGIGNYKILDLLEQQYNKIIPTTRNNLLITQGATEAISLLYLYLQTLIGEPFSVMAFSPAYESYSQLPQQFGHKFVEASMNEDGGFDSHELEHQISENNVRIMFFSSPGNPYGRIMPKASVEKLIEICHRHQCYLIIDAVYKELYYDQPPYIPVEHIGPQVFYVNSFSKLLSITGWRVGYLISHESHMEAIRQMHDYTGLCANSVLQEAVALYLEKYNMGFDYASCLRVKFAASYKRMSSVLENLGFKIPQTDGGYFIWAQQPAGYEDGFETALRLYEATGIATVPGIHFSPSGKNYIRFNIARPENEIEMAVGGIEKFFG